MRVRRIAAAMCLATGFVAGGDVSATATPAACSYRAQQVAGLPGGNGEGELAETDGERHFVGWGFLGTSIDPYPHGTVWRDGQAVTDFGALNGANSVNRSGDAVGYAFSSTAGSFLPRGGTMTRLANHAQMSRSNPTPTSIGDDGLIIGNGRFDDGTYHGLSWSIGSAATAVRDLGVLGTVGPPSQWLPGLKEVSDTGGRIVGSVRPGDRFRAVAGTAGSLAPLGGVDPSLDSDATDIAGRFVLGTGTVPGQGRGAVLWEDGVARLLPVSGTATDVNSSGVVVGYQTTAGADQGFVLANGALTTLPPLPGHTWTRALTVTEDGRVAGRSSRRISAEKIERIPVIWTCG